MLDRTMRPGLLPRVVALALALVVILAASAVAIRRESEPIAGGADALLAADAVADVAAELDYDLDRVYRFVADEIAYEPYVGVLRGAEGTLSSRAGNSWDQALLLAALLDESLIDYRFARGTLDAPAAADLEAATLRSSADARAGATELLFGDLEEAVVTASEPGSEARARAAAAAEGVDATIEDARVQLEDGISTIERALAEAGLEMPTVDRLLPAAEVDDHAWIQAAFGSEWLDLDPSVPGREAGSKLSEPFATLDAVPDELRHIVELDVLLEQVRGSTLETESILTYSAFADELAGRPVTFGHIKPAGLERLGITVRNLLGDGGLQYNVAIDVDGQSFVSGEAVTFGIVGSDGGGGLFEDSDLFGESTAEPSAAAEGEATAEWLEVRLTAPGGEPVTARRTVFDRVPPAQRFGDGPRLDALASIDLVDLDGNGELDYAPLVGMESFVVVTSGVTGASLVRRATDPDAGVLGAMALAYHYLRDSLAAEIGIDRAVRTFADGPNVASVSMSVDAEPPEPMLRFGIDIWHRNSGTLPLADIDATATSPALVAGVLAHVAERVATEPPTIDRDSPADDQAVGVSRLFEAAEAAGTPIIAFAGALPAGAAYGPEALARMQVALGAGDIIVAPEAPVALGGRDRVGWWRIDAASGKTADVMDDGSGSESTEYQLPLTWQFRAANCVLALSGSIIAAIVEILDISGFGNAKHGVALAGIIFQAFSAARGWTGSCR